MSISVMCQLYFGESSHAAGNWNSLLHKAHGGAISQRDTPNHDESSGIEIPAYTKHAVGALKQVDSDQPNEQIK